MSKLEIEDVLSKIRDNHVFADLGQGMVVEPRISGFEGPALYLHMVSPDRFGENPGGEFVEGLELRRELDRKGSHDHAAPNLLVGLKQLKREIAQRPREPMDDYSPDSRNIGR